MDPDRLLEQLLDGGVEFVIVGGVASVLHGSTLLTRDLDICIPLDTDALLRLQKALQGLNPRVRAGSERVPLELDEARASTVKNLYITTDEGRLDCVGFVEGVGAFDVVQSESEEFDLGGYSCRVLSLDALIRSKEALGRPQDLQTVVQLKAIRERTRSKEPPGKDLDDR
jgi:predicted nucleotidyltransferase